jgi:transcriptional regulator with XRE-family HTH domain
MLRGDDVREFRERHRLTQLKLAVLMDVDPQTVSRWEREETPRSRMLELALKGLEVELSQQERQTQ